MLLIWLDILFWFLYSSNDTRLQASLCVLDSKHSSCIMLMRICATSLLSFVLLPHNRGIFYGGIRQILTIQMGNCMMQLKHFCPFSIGNIMSAGPVCLPQRSSWWHWLLCSSQQCSFESQVHRTEGWQPWVWTFLCFLKKKKQQQKNWFLVLPS